MSVKKSLKLSDEPWDVAAVGENEAIITFLVEKLMIYSTYTLILT